MVMRELTSGEQDACRIAASKKVDQFVQCVESKDIPEKEKWKLLCEKFNFCATESVRQLENFTNKTNREENVALDPELRKSILKTGLTYMFMVNTLCDKMKNMPLAQVNGSSLQFLSFLVRANEERIRFDISHEVYKHEGIPVGNEHIFEGLLAKLSVKTAPCLAPCRDQEIKRERALPVMGVMKARSIEILSACLLLPDLLTA